MTPTSHFHKQSNGTGQDQSLYYNHLLHFKNNQWDNAYPFLQGLMSNDLFPAYNKYGNFEAYATPVEVDNVLSESDEMNPAAETVLKEEQVEHPDIEVASNKDAPFENSALIEENSVLEPASVPNNMTDSQSIDQEITIDAPSIEDHHTLTDSTEEQENLSAQPIDFAENLKMETNMEAIEEKADVRIHQEILLEPEEALEQIPLEEIIEEAQKIQGKPKKTHSIKKSQKKILKKNILFFNELPELNNFNKWLIQQKPMDEGNLVNLLKLQKKAKKLNKKRVLNEGIEASIQKNDKLVTEALAKILAGQGHYQEAIEMYKQLILIIPEKSHTFAAQIDELNKKII